MSRYVVVMIAVGLACGACTGPRTGATSAEDCTVCHGDPTRQGDELRKAAPPLGVHIGTIGRADTGDPGVGAHQSHLGDSRLSRPTECTECHTVPTRDGQLSSDAPGHLDGVVELDFSGRAAAGGVRAEYDASTHTCTVYCHGVTLPGGSNQHPTWNAVGVGQAACGTCHAAPPPPPHPASAPDRCWNCHPSMRADGTLDPELHIDGEVELNEVTCHSCHGSEANPAPPVDTRGRSDTHLPSVGAHQAHVNDGPVARAFVCGDCHPTPDPTHIFDHINGVVELEFGALASTAGVTASFDPATNTCTTYCHFPPRGGGSLHRPDWVRVDGTQAECGTCHGAPPESGTHPQSSQCHLCHPTVDRDRNFIDKAKHVDGTVDLVTDFSCNRCHGSETNAAPPVDTNGLSSTASPGVGAHQSHLVPPGTNPIAAPFACSACHNPVPTSADPLAHIDGVADVDFGTLAAADGATPVWNSGAATCSVYCHGQTLSGGSNTAPSWTTVDGSQDACGTCHGRPPLSPHPPSSATGCSECHTNVNYTAGTWSFTDPSQHVNGHVEVANLACNTCHGNANNAAPPVDTQGRSSTSLVTVGAHQAHLEAGLFANAFPCDTCHVVPTDLSHIDGAAEVSFHGVAVARATTATWDASGATCSVYCHGTPLTNGAHMQPVWTGGSGEVYCGACHGLPPVTALHPTVDPTSCATCHGSVVNTDLSWKDKSLHLNGVVNFN